MVDCKEEVVVPDEPLYEVGGQLRETDKLVDALRLLAVAA